MVGKKTYFVMLRGPEKGLLTSLVGDACWTPVPYVC